MLPKDSLRNRPASHRALRWSQITMRDTPRLLLRLGLLLGLSVPLHAKAERPKPPLPTPNHLPPPLPNPLPPPPSVPSLTTLPPEQRSQAGLPMISCSSRCHLHPVEIASRFGSGR
jgi:hypothetical protein